MTSVNVSDLRKLTEQEWAHCDVFLHIKMCAFYAEKKTHKHLSIYRRNQITGVTGLKLATFRSRIFLYEIVKFAYSKA